MEYKRIAKKEHLAEMRWETALLYAGCDTYGQFRMKRDLRFPELPWFDRTACRMHYLCGKYPKKSLVVLIMLLAMPVVVAIFCPIPLVGNMPPLEFLIRVICAISGPVAMFHLMFTLFGDMMTTLDFFESKK